MEANEDDDMEVDDDQELVIIPVRHKGKDAKLLKAYSTSAGLTTIQINNSKHSGTVVCEICSLSVTSMAATWWADTSASAPRPHGTPGI